MNSEITIQQGFPDVLRSEAAALYDAAFGSKLSIAIPDTKQRIVFEDGWFKPESSDVPETKYTKAWAGEPGA